MYAIRSYYDVAPDGEASAASQAGVVRHLEHGPVVVHARPARDDHRHAAGLHHAGEALQRAGVAHLDHVRAQFHGHARAMADHVRVVLVRDMAAACSYNFV